MIEEILNYCKENNCSDVHISSGSLISFRLNGEIFTLPNSEILTKDEVYGYIKSITSQEQIERYLVDLEIDFAIQVDDVRFRANAYHTIKGPAIVFREIPPFIKKIEELNLPKSVKRFTNFPHGLVLIVGPTGHGKSSTLTALIDIINTTQKKHIITIEDPVEFVHSNKQCIIDQREVGSSAKSFSAALKSALREDPDIILVGEMRDLETIQLALTAAETGHLVFATLHTSSAVNTISRIIDVFPANSQSTVRSMLSSSLKAILSQHLVPGINGNRYPICELMFASNSIKNLIRESNLHQINSIIEISKKAGMITLRDSVKNLFDKGFVSEEVMSEIMANYK